MVDEELMLQARNDDLKAFDELIQRYWEPGLRYCCKLTNDPILAEDLVQECFLKLFIMRKNYEIRAKFSTLFYKILKNSCIDEHRKRTKLKFNSLNISSHDDFQISPYEIFEEKELLVCLREAIKKLPEFQKLALVMREFGEFSYKEIAEALKCSGSSAKMLVHRARRNLAENILRLEQTTVG